LTQPVCAETVPALVKKALFICTGNYYRSRLSQLLFNHYAEKADLDWDATSRGILSQSNLHGLSPHAVAYLESVRLGHLADDPRDPVALSVDDLPAADLIILLNRSEHQPMVLQRYRWVVQALENEGKIRWWNIYDLPPKMSVKEMLFSGAPSNFGQPHDSATEHIHFAVQALVAELKAGELRDAAASPSQQKK